MSRSSAEAPAGRSPVGPVPAVYAIADAATLAPRSLADGVLAMADAGIHWIQLRAKHLPTATLCRELERCLPRLPPAVRLWIDDRADVAALYPVAGVHVGQDDLPPAAARRVVGPAVWIGHSTHGEAQFVAADADPDVDVLAFGPVFPTVSKADPDPVVGLAELSRLRTLTRKPLVAIGGIDAANLAAVLAAGADAVAVIAAACRGDVAANCRALLAAARGSR